MNAIELKFKKMGTTQLLLKVEKLNGEEKLVCIEVLKGRNQDVSKWESKIPVTEVSSAKVYEIEPEEELTETEQKLVESSEKELDKTLKPSSLKDQAAAHILNFKKGTNGFIRIQQILEGRKINKLFDHELRMIISVPIEKIVEKEKKAKETRPKKEKTEKAEPKEKKVKAEGGSLAGYVSQFTEKVMTEDEIKALKTKREKVIACWFSNIRDVSEISRIAEYAKGNVRGIIHLSNLK